MRKLTLALLGLLTLALVSDARAQTSIQIGPRVGYELDTVEELFIGADARLGFVALPVQANGAFDYFFVDGGSYWQIDANALYPFIMDNAVFTPYVGAGLALTHLSVDNSDFSETEAGLNIVGGATFGAPAFPARPFIHARVTFAGGDFDDTASLAAGLLFDL